MDLSVNTPKNTHIPLKEIAERQNISERYLEQIFSNLKRAGLVKSIRGAGGGYRLGKPAKTIRVKEILQVLEGELSLVPEAEYSGDRMQRLIYKAVWEKVNRSFIQVVEEMTLEQLADKSRELNNNKSMAD